MTKIKIIIFFVLLISPDLIQAAFCAPFSYEIDKINRNVECLDIVSSEHVRGTVLTVANNCENDFYLSGGDSLKKDTVIVNAKDFDNNKEKYKELEEETGIIYENKIEIEIGTCGNPLYGLEGECYDCPNGEIKCSEEEMIKEDKFVDGVNVCKEDLKDGTVVDYWSVVLSSSSANNEDFVIAEGRTIFDESLKARSWSKNILIWLLGLMVSILTGSIMWIVLKDAYRKNKITFALLLVLFIAGIGFVGNRYLF